jgi:Ser/Thr protein kinase RdoA (MazF antagonist)
MEPRDVEQAAAVFGLGRVVEAPRVAGRGKEGVLWRLVTQAGPFAVKEVLERPADGEVETDVAFVTEMAGRGVHAPAPLRAGDGRVLAEVGTGTLRVSTWVDLDEARSDLDPVAVGALFATLHRDPAPAPPPSARAAAVEVDPWYTDPVPAREWDDVTRALVAERAPFAPEFVATAPLLLGLQDLFRPPVELRTCHRDLWADNVRGTPGGRLCVIDWDNCGPQDPTQEVCVALVEFCLGDPDRAAALWRSYRAGGGTGRPADRGDFTMVLAQFGHFAVTAGRDWLDAPDDPGRDDAEAWFRELLDYPLDLAGIDLLLAAVRDA